MMKIKTGQYNIYNIKHCVFQIQCLEEVWASLQNLMQNELQCLFFPNCTHLHNDETIFSALGNPCSEYRFEVAPELELLFLILSL
jgi:hypothetical protein